MSYISAIGTAVPENRFAQNDLCAFMVRAMQLNETDARRLRTIFKSSGIDYRHSVLDDYGKEFNYSFYPNTTDFEPFPSTEKRLEVYSKHALQLSEAAIRNCVDKLIDFNYQQVTHLIVVSCTGMYAPGLDIDLVQKLNLQPGVQRTCVNFMGCYAAFNAMKIADSFCKAYEKSKVLVLCTEMCSIHFQKQVTDDNLLANTLFADGAAAMLIESEPREGINLRTEVFHNALSPSEDHHMAWSIGNMGFEMKLSSYVPEIIQHGIRTLTNGLLEKIDRSITDVAHFAIHPGGKKILSAIEFELGLTHDQNAHAYYVLRNYGNMSSPTVVFVLDRIMKTLTTSNQDDYILSFAFGPGLTLESMLLRIQIL